VYRFSDAQLYNHTQREAQIQMLAASLPVSHFDYMSDRRQKQMDRQTPDRHDCFRRLLKMHLFAHY